MPADIAAAYDRWAESYDADENPTRDLAADVVRRRSFELAGRIVFEIGCGTGRNTAWLAERARSVVAMDFSPEMLERAHDRVRSDRVEFLLHDVRDPWPIPGGSIDLTVCTLVLEHVERLGPIFEQAARVLRPNGRLFVCELHPFRQIGGGQAEFTHPKSGRRVRIPSFIHDVSDYVNAGLAAGLRLVRMEEWRDDDDASRTRPPRLLSLELEWDAESPSQLDNGE